MPALDDYYRFLERHDPPTKAEAEGNSAPPVSATAYRWTIRGGLTIRVPVAPSSASSDEGTTPKGDLPTVPPSRPSAEMLPFAPPILELPAADGPAPDFHNGNGNAAPESWSVALPVVPLTTTISNGGGEGNGQLGLPLLTENVPIAVPFPVAQTAAATMIARGDGGTTGAHWDRLPTHLKLLARYLDPQADEEVRQTVERLLDPTVTLEESAKLLGVCAATVRRYANKGILGHQRTPGNQRRFRLSEVAAFLERQSNGLADLSNGGNGDGHE